MDRNPIGGDELIFKEKVAIDAYFKNGFNKTAAMKTAGYTGTHPSSCATFWNKPRVRREMGRREAILFGVHKKAEKRFNITEERIVREYCLIAFAPLDGSSLGKNLKFALMTGGIIPAGVEKGMSPVSAKDKKAALDSLAKWKGMFIERIEVTGDAEVIKRLNEGRQQARLKAAPEPNIEDPPDTVTLKEGEDGLFK